MQINKKKRKLRKSIKITLIVILVLAIAGILSIPSYRTKKALRKLGYDTAAIKIIRQEKLTDTILQNGYYSNYLAKVIKDHSIVPEYMHLYAAVEEDRKLTDVDFLLYNRLLDRGYESDQLENLFQKLTFDQITPLLLFDYQWDENPYIEDVLTNDITSLKGSYLTPYKVPVETKHPDDYDVLINKQNYLPDGYAPDDLTTISSQYSAGEIQLRAEAADAFTNMAATAINEGHNFFATQGYRSQDGQESAYQYYVNTVGENKADKYATKARFSEHETGLAVNVVPTYEEGEFVDTEVCAWLRENAVKYGFIVRYPPEQAYLTGYGDEPNHYRYLGKKLAEIVSASNLPYDIFYSLYLADWDDEANKPSTEILNATNPMN